MALGALVDIVFGILDALGMAGQAAEATRRSSERTRAPSWRSAVWAWLLIAASGVALWWRFWQFFESYPNLALVSAIVWIIGLLLVLLMTGAAFECWFMRRRSGAPPLA
jgi:hypothetical protein